MKEIFKNIILDFQETNIPKFIFRNIDFPIFFKNIKKAFIYVGVRRSGKTYLMFQKIRSLLEKKIAKENIVYINFEDDRLENIVLKNLQEILDAYFELYPQNNNKKCYFFLDEIQVVKGWEKFIRRILDTRNIEIYISGSSSKMLSKEISTSLRGRTIVREVFPFNFLEFLRYKNVIKTNISKNVLSSKMKSLIIHESLQFLYFGGFPETIGMDVSIHRELLQSYMNSVIYRDIIERYKVKNILSLKKILIQNLQNPATFFSINKFYQSLKSLGHSISKDSLYLFMRYFEDAYTLFFVSCFDLSNYKKEQKPKKNYPVDQGLITAFSILDGLKNSQRLETSVFCALRQKNDKIFYYHTKDKKEIDFVFIDKNQKIFLFQVTLSLKDEKTKKREILAITSAFTELRLKEAFIITLDEEEIIKLKNGIIYVIPIWKFLLNWL